MTEAISPTLSKTMKDNDSSNCSIVEVSCMDVSFRQAETNIINVEADLCKERPTIRDLSSHPVGVENSPWNKFTSPWRKTINSFLRRVPVFQLSESRQFFCQNAPSDCTKLRFKFQNFHGNDTPGPPSLGRGHSLPRPLPRSALRALTCGLRRGPLDISTNESRGPCLRPLDRPPWEFHTPRETNGWIKPSPSRCIGHLGDEY